MTRADLRVGVRDINSTGLKKPGAIPAFLFLDFVALEGFINLNRLARPRLRGNDGILGSGFAFDYSSFRVVIQTFERNESALNATFFKKIVENVFEWLCLNTITLQFLFNPCTDDYVKSINLCR